ncbi:MAG: hypothetical protein CL912_27440 [Deltaproteobacteria bacterium]|nr:hypothetical protein [Deltaproteobacteria bacterium]
MNENILAMLQNSTVSGPAIVHQGSVGVISEIWNGISGWQLGVTVLVILMAYDQCKAFRVSCVLNLITDSPQLHTCTRKGQSPDPDSRSHSSDLSYRA